MEENNQNVNPAQSVSSVVQTPPIQTPPVSNPSNPQWQGLSLPKIVIVAILFLLIAGSAAGFYVFKPQLLKIVSKPTPISTVNTFPNWKTFKNSTYDFSFQYPDKDWLINTAAYNSEDRFCADKATESGELWIYHIKTPEGIPCEKLGDITPLPYVTNSIYITVDSSTDLLDLYFERGFPNKKDIQFAGENAIEIDTEYNNKDNAATMKEIFVKHDEKMFYIKYGIEKNDIEFEKFVTNILTTFKFTKPPVIDTSTWKNYSNDTLGLTLFYPPTWTSTSSAFSDVLFSVKNPSSTDSPPEDIIISAHNEPIIGPKEYVENLIDTWCTKDTAQKAKGLIKITSIDGHVAAQYSFYSFECTIPNLGPATLNTSLFLLGPLVFIRNNNSMITIQTSDQSINNGKIFNRILSTVKFTN